MTHKYGFGFPFEFPSKQAYPQEDTKIHTETQAMQESDLRVVFCWKEGAVRHRRALRDAKEEVQRPSYGRLVSLQVYTLPSNVEPD